MKKLKSFFTPKSYRDRFSLLLAIRIILYFSLPMVIGTTASAQNLDSLWNVWQDENQADTMRLKAIYQIAWDGYLFSKPDSAFYYAQLQYDFARRIGLKKHMASALNTQGASFYFRGNYPKALEYYRQSLSLLEELGNKSASASLLANIGNIYREQGNHAQALENYQKSKSIWEELGDKRGIASSLSSIGSLYRTSGNYRQALEYAQRSLAIREELGDNREVALALNNIAVVYSEQGKLIQALEFYQNCLSIFKELGDKRGMATTLTNIGGIYRDLGKYENALEYAREGLVIHEEVGSKQGIALSLNSIGSVYSEQGKTNQALEYCEKGLKLAESIGLLQEQKQACRCLYGTYKTMGKSKEALKYLEKLNAVNDSLQADETNKKLQQMEFAKLMLQDSIVKAEEARLVKEAHEEEIRKKKQSRNMAYTGGLLALLLAGGFYSRWRYVQRSRDLISKEKDRSENLLLNILPEEIATELKEKGRADARRFDTVSILFSDFKEFTQTSEKLSPEDLVYEIHTCFEAFDGIMEKHGIEKIKTIGDAYMAAGGLPVPSEDSVKNTVLAGLEMQQFITDRKKQKESNGEPAFEMRVGIHTGPVVAGIVGVKKFQYDIWGDTVNTASRMESSGEVEKVNISQHTYDLLKDDPEFTFDSRGKIEAKGKGEIEMYFVREKLKRIPIGIGSE